MAWSVDTATWAGGVCVAALARTGVSVSGGKGKVAAYGSKEPVLVLVLSRGRLGGIDMAGSMVEPDEIERRYPTATEKFRAAADRAHARDNEDGI